MGERFGWQDDHLSYTELARRSVAYNEYIKTVALDANLTSKGIKIMSKSPNKALTAYKMERIVVVSAIMQMCHQYGGGLGPLDSRTMSFPIASGAFNPMFSVNNTTDEISWWNTNKDDIIKMMKAINLREKGNSVFSLVLDEIRGFGDDINMDLMMHLLHQGPSTRSLSCGEWQAYMKRKFPTKQQRDELHEAKSIVAKACGRIILKDFETYFITQQDPEQVAQSIK